MQGFIQADQGLFRDLQVAHLLGDLGIIHHAHADEGHLAAVPHGGIRHLLHAGDERSEGGDDDAAGGSAEDLIEGRTDHPFGGCPAGTFGIGRIGQQHIHAAGGELGQLGEIGRPVIHRGLVELVIAGVDDQPGRGGDAQADGIRDGVADMEGLDLERADLEGLAGLDGVQIGLAGQTVACQFDLDQAAGQGRGIDRGRHVRQQVLDGTDMVLVTVGDDDPMHLGGMVAQILEIRDDVVHPEHVIIGEHQAGIHDQDVAVVFVGHHVLADLAQAAEGDDP